MIPAEFERRMREAAAARNSHGEPDARRLIRVMVECLIEAGFGKGVAVLAMENGR